MGISLKTKRLLLRSLRFTDWRAVQEYASDPRVTRFMIWGTNKPAETKKFIKLCLKQQKQRPRRRFDWAMEEKATGKLIGVCGLGVLPAGTREGGEIGYCLNRKVWGRGYATEATKTMLKFGFQKIGFRRITATCDAKNKASARVLEKAGMKREGHLRKNVFQKGKWRDTYLYAVLKEGSAR